ncbi:6-phosphogluconolactonase [Sphingomicrobium sediminis]|uniref:6-phosphogluconolactonase n=1 Tax=Sphingomicrobium sediminis TaxID=2950949 RepID=A0A9X2EGG0_9SPHN|nr:6-phosphogluconolactonase [Sphingomicrobium sediminis]MCM8556216.1 6-phosphogluconolactonase [Sphingomicrobium sediminis]
MIEAEWWDYDDREEMAAAVAGDIGFIIESAIDARGESLLAFPGGGTPQPIFEKLAQKQLPWKRVTIIPGDDRLVPVDNELSNIRAIAQAMISTGARIYPIATENDDYVMAGHAANARLKDLKWPPDLVWLGMGTDGHTASLFPGPDLDAAMDAPKANLAMGVHPDPMPPEAPVDRVTLTRAGILQARTIIVTITGQEKRDILEQGLEDGHSSKLPIVRVLAESEFPIDIHWAP